MYHQHHHHHGHHHHHDDHHHHHDRYGHHIDIMMQRQKGVANSALIPPFPSIDYLLPLLLLLNLNLWFCPKFAHLPLLPVPLAMAIYGGKNEGSFFEAALWLAIITSPAPSPSSRCLVPHVQEPPLI
jgi:hypothetical protein